MLRVAIALTVLAFACMITAVWVEHGAQKVVAAVPRVPSNSSCCETISFPMYEANCGCEPSRESIRAARKEFNWAIQGQDPAADGCPGQYHQYADINNETHVLIGCWGKK